MLVTRSRCSCRRAAALAALPCLLLLAVTPARQAAGQPAADEGSVSGGEMLVQVMIELTDEEAAVPAEEGSSASGEDEKGGGESAGARRAAGTFEDHVGSGLQLYQAGSYAAALAEFQAAYQLVPEVNLLYNIARCFEKLGRKERAIASYRQFLSSSGARNEDRAKAASYLGALLEQEEEGKGRTGGRRGVKPAAGRGAPAAAQRSRGLEWTLIGVGLVALTAGSVFGSLALGKYEEFQDARGYDQQRELKDAVDGHALIADCFFAGAGAAILGGTLLFLLRGEPAATTGGGPASAALLLPGPLAGGWGATASISF